MDIEFYDLVDTYKNNVAHNHTNLDKEKYSINFNKQDRLKEMYYSFYKHEIFCQLLEEHLEYYHTQ